MSLRMSQHGRFFAVHTAHVTRLFLSSDRAAAFALRQLRKAK